MSRRLFVVLLLLAVSTVALVGCGPDPKEEYATSASAIVDDWRAIVDEWNAAPGDAKAATEFASLEARAKAIKPPEEMTSLHGLLLKGMEAERTSFEAYALGKKEYSTSLHLIALDTMENYEQALQNLGLVK